jgi:hypothetical protein
MKRKIKRKTTEYYTNGQIKMVVEYKGDWNSGDFIVKKHYDYDANGRLMRFKDQFERLEFLDKYHKKVINLEKKDFNKPWKCALAIKKLIKAGDLDFTEEDGYKWAMKYCTVNGEKINDYKILIEDYNSAMKNNIEKVIKFEKK